MASPAKGLVARPPLSKEGKSREWVFEDRFIGVRVAIALSLTVVVMIHYARNSVSAETALSNSVGRLKNVGSVTSVENG